MVKLFILIKRKGSKKFLGAIPANPGVTSSQLRTSFAKSIKPGLSFRIVSESQLRGLIVKTSPKRTRKAIRRKGIRLIRRRKKTKFKTRIRRSKNGGSVIRRRRR